MGKTPKETTNHLLETMLRALNPTRTVVEKKLHDSVQPLSALGAKVSFRQDLEAADFHLSIQVDSQEKINELTKKLSAIDFFEMQQVIAGRVTLED